MKCEAVMQKKTELADVSTYREPLSVCIDLHRNASFWFALFPKNEHFFPAQMIFQNKGYGPMFFWKKGDLFFMERSL